MQMADQGAFWQSPGSARHAPSGAACDKSVTAWAYRTTTVRVARSEGDGCSAKNSDRQNARIRHDKALQSLIASMMLDQVELFRY